MKTYHIPIFVPHKGCPHDCVFCNQRHITGQMTETKAEDVKKIIDDHLSTIGGKYYAEVAFFGGSFTAIELCKQTELLSVAYPYVKSGKINGIRCSTRPDCIDDTILENLKKFGTVCIELGVQSTDSEVLRLSRRGHTFDDVIKASQKIKLYGIDLGLQMMLGLPGDTRQKMIKTAKDLISLKPKCVRIYPTLVVKDTALFDMYEKGVYTPLTTEEAVDILSEIIPMFKRNGIQIIRTGLQTTDEINEHTVKGPYHPAIKELAEGRIVRNVIEKNLKTNEMVTKVFSNPKTVSLVSGHKSCNKEYFKEKYGIKIEVSQDSSLLENELKIYDKIIAIC